MKWQTGTVVTEKENTHTWNEHSIAMIGNIKGYHGNQRTLGNGVEIVDIYVEPMMVHAQIELDVRCEV